MFNSKNYSRKNQTGAVLLVFLGVMVAIMSAVTILQEQYSMNKDSIYLDILKTQLKATSESAVNLKREKLHDYIVNQGQTPAIDFNVLGGFNYWDYSVCLQKLNYQTNRAPGAQPLLPEMNVEFDSKPITYYSTGVIIPSGGTYQIISCAFNSNTIDGSDHISGHIQTLVPFPADNPTELKSVGWQEF